MSQSKKIIDLTFEIHEGMQTFMAPWHPYVKISQLGRHGIENRETRELVIGTHTGTHIDAPRHFIADGKTIEQIPLAQLVGPATVLDFSDLSIKTEIGLDLFKERLKDFPCKKVICRMDWCQRFGTNEYYTDHPYLSEDVCQWLVDNGCELIALDTPQPDNPLNGRGSKNDSPNHKILLGNDVIIVEYLKNIAELNEATVELFVAPLLVKDGDGAPARCFAVIN